MNTFSVTISVYKNDNPRFFIQAMDSIINQTVTPNEIVLTVDGPIPQDLNEIVIQYENKYNYIKVVRIEKNVGLGIAHQIGVQNSNYDLIAIMDSDDIAVPDRFEKQLRCFEENMGIDVLGGFIYEFIDTIDTIVAIRAVPLNHVEIIKYLKKRCPMNHVTAMFKKNAVLKSGNYQDWHFDEDYYLWCRMMLAGCMFKNISDVLVYVRVGKDMYERRGGWKYYKSEAQLQKFMLDNKVINFFEYIINVVIRFIVQVLLPNNIRSFIFKVYFRKRAK
ncbi:MAG: glycosyltransferase [Bacteroidales bacterium]|jgi:glycosyltransferase involved in cell wall biosynthesis|nr:glycosyltransferase [Bacteroidales bacterium]